jgi:hypothetical protein
MQKTRRRVYERTQIEVTVRGIHNPIEMGYVQPFIIKDEEK